MSRRFIGASLVLAAVFGAVPASAGGGANNGLVGIRLADPDSPEEEERGAIITTERRGDELERTVAVANGTTERMRVKLYAESARIGFDGFEIGEPGDTNAASRWTTVTPERLNLRPGQEKEATVTISIPRKAAGGDHAAIVWAELPSANDQSVTVVNRVGVRIYLRVEGRKGSDIVGTALWILLGLVALGLVVGILMLLASRRSRPTGRTPARMHDEPPPPPRPEPYRPPTGT